jgi:hypothetical protein
MKNEQRVNDEARDLPNELRAIGVIGGEQCETLGQATAFLPGADQRGCGGLR